MVIKNITKNLDCTYSESSIYPILGPPAVIVIISSIDNSKTRSTFNRQFQAPFLDFIKDTRLNFPSIIF